MALSVLLGTTIAGLLAAALLVLPGRRDSAFTAFGYLLVAAMVLSLVELGHAFVQWVTGALHSGRDLAAVIFGSVVALGCLAFGFFGVRDKTP